MFWIQRSGIQETIKGSHEHHYLNTHPSFLLLRLSISPLNSVVQSLIPRFHFKCIKLSDEEAEKIRKSTSPLTRPFTDSTDDYICENCRAATGKKTTSKSNQILILLTPHLSVPVDSLLCHLLPIPIHYCYVYCLLGLFPLRYSMLADMYLDVGYCS